MLVGGDPSVVRSDWQEAMPLPGMVCDSDRRGRLFDRLTDVIVSPTKAFNEIARDADWLRPTVTMLAIMSVYAIVLAAKVPVPPAGDFGLTNSVATGIGIRAAGVLLALVTALFGWCVWVTTLYVSFWAFGAKTSLPQTLAVVVYAAVPNMLKTGMLTVLAFVKGGVPVLPTAASLFDIDGAWGIVLTTVEPFSIWNFLLLVIAATCCFRLSRIRAVAAILVPVALGWSLQAAMAHLLTP